MADPMDAPVVSVLLPVFNRAALVGEAIQSALAQTYTDLEVVVVDDGSTDGTAAKVRSFTDRRIRLIQQENRGIGGALNTALRAARGRYLARIDSDDLWLPELLAVEVPILEADAAVGLVYPRAQAMDIHGRPLSQFQGAPERYPGHTFASLLYGNHVCQLGILIRRECVAAAGGWDESLLAYEDWDLWLRLSRLCGFRFVDRVLARFRLHPGRSTAATRTRLARLTADPIRILDRAFAQPDLPSKALAVKPLAYRNAYTEMGLRCLSAGAWRQALGYFSQAVRVAPRAPGALVRIVYLAFFHHYLGKRRWGANLVRTLVDWRCKHGL